MRGGVLLVSHGTVDDLDDLAAFVANVRRGHSPSADVVAELRRRYQAIGGRSPLNALNAALAGKLAEKLGVRVAWANRLWKPYVRDVLRGMAREGAERVAIVPLAQHSAHVYADDARSAAQGTGIDLVCARNWGSDPGLCAAFAQRVARVLPKGALSRTSVLMTAHSLPRAVVAAGDPYPDEVHKAAESIAARVRALAGQDVAHAVAFQSQGLGGGPAIEWLGPDVKTALDEAKARGDRRIVFAPIGFLADHMEVLYDLDVEARGMAEARGLEYARSPSLNADDDLVQVLAEIARPLLDGRGRG